MSNYNDIIELNRPVSSKRRPMSVEMRAAQFAPFSALTGYNDAVQETARSTEAKKELSEGIKEIINEKLNYIKNNIEIIGDVKITYFIADLKKSGGSYKSIIGKVKKIERGFIYMISGEMISFENISNISLEELNYLEM